MRNFKFKRSLTLVAGAALAASLLVAAPTVASANPVCDGKFPVETCGGATSDGAPYAMMVPANFNGTVYLYSHGYRPNVPVPAGIPGYGGYTVTNTPQPGPNATVIGALLAKGYGVVGSGFARQGWNADSAIKTNVELVGAFKKQFTKTTKVVAWGESLGGFITQALAEKHPDLFSAAAPLCMASDITPLMTMAGDALWGIKTFFDPTIKGGGYSAGAAGYAEAMGDLVKVFTVIGSLQAAVASQTSFILAINPAFAALENVANAAALAVLATHDLELQAGGAVFDNTATDYSARIAEEQFIWASALSGNSGTAGLLSVLAASPRAKANPAAVEKLKTLTSHSGKVEIPTILFTGVADPITTAGNQQSVADKYAAYYAEKWEAVKKAKGYKRPANNQLVLWNFPLEKYPDTSVPAATGTNHCNFTTSQYMAIADLLAYASTNGKHLSGGPLLTKIRKAGNMTYDRGYSAPRLKYYGSN